MKSVLISIRPEWCKRIASGQKTIEIRKTCPKIKPPFKCYVYCTKPPQKLITIIKDGEEWGDEIYHGKPVFITWDGVVIHENPIDRGYQMVVGEFTCDDVRRIGPECCIVKEDIESAISGSCLNVEQVKKYAGWNAGMRYADMKDLYGWHISDLKIYDEPRKLQSFTGLQETRFGMRPVEIHHPPQSWRYIQEEGDV